MKKSVIYELPMIIIDLALLTGILYYSFVSALESSLRTKSNFNTGRWSS